MNRELEIKKKAGFTLIEVLVAVAIMTLMIATAASVEIFYLHQADLNKHTIQANNLADEALSQMEILRDRNIANNLSSAFSSWPSDWAKITVDSHGNPTNLQGGDANGEKITIDGVDYYLKIKISN